MKGFFQYFLNILILGFLDLPEMDNCPVHSHHPPLELFMLSLHDLVMVGCFYQISGLSVQFLDLKLVPFPLLFSHPILPLSFIAKDSHCGLEAFKLLLYFDTLTLFFLHKLVQAFYFRHQIGFLL